MHRSRVPVLSCGEDWAQMTGDSRRRFCATCQHHVENLSMRTEAETIALLERAAAGRLCVRYEVDKKGEIVFRPEAKDPLPRRGALAAGAMAAMLQGCASSPASAPLPPPPAPAPAPLHATDESAQPGGCKVPDVEPTVEMQTNADPSKAMLHGVVWSGDGKQPVTDAVVTLSGPHMQGEEIVLTDAAGAFRIPNLPPGDGYSLQIDNSAYKPYRRGGIRLEAGQRTFIKAAVMPDATDMLQGVLVMPPPPPSIDTSSSTQKQTVDQDFWRRVPLVR